MNIEDRATHITITSEHEKKWRDAITRLITDGRTIEVFSRAVDVNGREKLREMLEETEDMLQQIREYMRPSRFPSVYRETVKELNRSLRYGEQWVSDVNSDLTMRNRKAQMQMLYDYLNREISNTIEEILNIRLTYVVQ